jgi:hypothetical protein
MKNLIPHAQTLPPYEFGLKIVDGKWRDLQLVRHLARVVPSLYDVSVERFLAVYRFCFHSSVFSRNLDECVRIVPSDSPGWNNLQDSLFWKKFGVRIRPLRGLFEAVAVGFDKFLLACESKSVVNREIATLTEARPSNITMNGIDPASLLLSVRQMNARLRERCEHIYTSNAPR